MAVLNARTIEIINNMTPGADQVRLGDLMEQALSGILPPGSVALSEIEMAATGKVITSNGTSAANTWKTISATAGAFTGVGATITPTAALATNPAFTGNALGTHQHDAVSAGTSGGTVTITIDSVTAGIPAGTVTGKLELAVPAFSGTGWTTAGQVVTTTDNQTMPAVDTAAGMWLVFDSSPASPPVLILSNTIVAGAPAVLTVQGVPAVTGAGTYKIFTMGAATFTGSALGAHTHTHSDGFSGAAMATHQHAAITAGIPAGSIDSPSITVTGASYTPAGSSANPSIVLT